MFDNRVMNVSQNSIVFPLGHWGFKYLGKLFDCLELNCLIFAMMIQRCKFCIINTNGIQCEMSDIGTMEEEEFYMTGIIRGISTLRWF